MIVHIFSLRTLDQETLEGEGDHPMCWRISTTDPLEVDEYCSVSSRREVQIHLVPEIRIALEAPVPPLGQRGPSIDSAVRLRVCFFDIHRGMSGLLNVELQETFHLMQIESSQPFVHDRVFFIVDHFANPLFFDGAISALCIAEST